MKNTSEEIERECRKLGVRTVFSTLRQVLMKVKTPREDIVKKDVVYEVPCLDCETSYIGETGRNLKKRITEHRLAVKKNNAKKSTPMGTTTEWTGMEPEYWSRNPDTGGERFWKRCTSTNEDRQATWTAD